MKAIRLRSPVAPQPGKGYNWQNRSGGRNGQFQASAFNRSIHRRRALRQLFVVLGFASSDMEREDILFVPLFSLITVGVLYVSLKIRVSGSRKKGA